MDFWNQVECIFFKWKINEKIFANFELFLGILWPERMNRGTEGSVSSANKNTPGEAGTSNSEASSQPNPSSNLIAATNESIKSIAETIGIANLSEEACRELAADLTFTIKSILIVKNS